MWDYIHTYTGSYLSPKVFVSINLGIPFLPIIAACLCGQSVQIQDFLLIEYLPDFCCTWQLAIFLIVVQASDIRPLLMIMVSCGIDNLNQDFKY